MFLNFQKEYLMRSESIEVLLQDVLDREDIRTLPVRYCNCVWDKDVDQYMDLFVDASAAALSINTDVLIPTSNEGQNKIREMISGVFNSAMNPRPFIHNHTVELLGPDAAKGKCYLEAHMVKEGKPCVMVAWYDDEYAKVNGKWKFKSRFVNVDSFETC